MKTYRFQTQQARDKIHQAALIYMQKNPALSYMEAALKAETEMRRQAGLFQAKEPPAHLQHGFSQPITPPEPAKETPGSPATAETYSDLAKDAKAAVDKLRSAAAYFQGQQQTFARRINPPGTQTPQRR